MNFKFILFLLFISCGVKGPPIAPSGTSIPSIQNKYLITPIPTTPAAIELTK